jgi:hypothetical protein
LGVVKRKKKKFSQDQNQRVIKFSTGEPYLEYLPHMLAKDNNKVFLDLFRVKNHRP